MSTKSDNIDVMMGSQEGLEELVRGSHFTLDGVDSLYYDLNKISLNRCGSYIDSPEWLKNKKATINPNNKDDKCFQYALTALNDKQIKKILKEYQTLNILLINITGKK